MQSNLQLRPTLHNGFFFGGGQALPPGFKRPSSLYYYEFVLLRATHVHYTLSPRLWLFLCIFFFQELIN